MKPRISEQELLDFVLDLAALQGWRVHHDRPARVAEGWRTAISGNKGFPDLALARRGVVLFRELKGYDARGRLGKATADQIAWGQAIAPTWDAIPDPLNQFTRQYALFDVWTPDDEDLIRATLTARRKAGAHV